MNNNFSDNNFSKTETNFNYFNKDMLKPNSIFRNFLIKENCGNVIKNLQFKRKEILPEYSDIKKKINYHINEIRSYYDIENTIFKEIKLKDTIAYSEFKKGMSLFFFGPQGAVTKRNKKLKKFYKIQEKNKIGLNTKIYAGRWEYYDESTKHNKYLNRLKTTRKKILKIGGNFSTEEDINDKLHAIYLKNKEKMQNGKISDSLRIDKNILNKKLRRYSVINNINQVGIFSKNFFEYTSIDPLNRKDSSGYVNNFSFRTNNKKYPTALTLPEILREADEDSFNRKKNLTMYNSSDLKKIKNIFKRTRLEQKIKSEKKKHFKKFGKKINMKLNSIVEPSKNLLDCMKTIKKNHQTKLNFKENKYIFKDDIKVIGEDFKKENIDNMNKFVETNTKKQRKKDDKSAPSKIYFSYYDKSRNIIHKSIREFVKNLLRNKEEEKERKYFKNIRQHFEDNRRTMNLLRINITKALNKGELNQKK